MGEEVGGGQRQRGDGAGWGWSQLPSGPMSVSGYFLGRRTWQWTKPAFLQNTSQELGG